MAIFVQNENVKNNQSFGQVINKAIKEYIEPELEQRKLTSFTSAGIEILPEGTHKVYLDNEVQLLLEFNRI